MELPAAAARSLGLDDAPHWIVCDDANRFDWVGPDLRPVPGAAGAWGYGMLPAGLYDIVRRKVIALGKRGTMALTDRD